MEPLLGLLIWILIFALIAGLAFWITTLLPLPPPWKQVVQAVIGVILLIILILKLLPMASAGMVLPAIAL